MMICSSGTASRPNSIETTIALSTLTKRAKVASLGWRMRSGAGAAPPRDGLLHRRDLLNVGLVAREVGADLPQHALLEGGKVEPVLGRDDRHSLPSQLLDQLGLSLGRP